MKRITALLLSLLLVLTLCVPAMAARTKPVDYNYVALGDSIPNVAEVGTVDVQLYPNVLALKLNRTLAKIHPEMTCHVTNLSYPGWRTAELRYILEENYEPDVFTQYVLQYYCGCTMEELDEYRKTYPGFIKNADLISIELGSNDLMGNTIFDAGLGLFKDVSTDSLANLVNILLKGDIIMDFLQDRNAPTNPEDLVDLINKLANLSPLNLNANLLDALLKGNLHLIPDTISSTLDSLLPTTLALSKRISDIKQEFRENWDMIIRDIRRLNPDATLVAVSLYVPPLVSNIPLISSMISPIIDDLNRYIREESPYTREYIYVDATNVYMLDNQDGLHPGPTGHDDIADLIYAELLQANQPCLHTHTEKRNVFRTPILHFGYSGDTYCQDCGMMLSRGTWKNLVGFPIQIPKTIDLDIYSFVVTNITHTLHNVFPFFV